MPQIGEYCLRALRQKEPALPEDKGRSHQWTLSSMDAGAKPISAARSVAEAGND
jgi:hypothetical protein